MKITTLIAAAALATASTTAIAQNADVTTADGELVMIEKNQAFAGLAGYFAAGAFITIVTIASNGGTD